MKIKKQLMPLLKQLNSQLNNQVLDNPNVRRVSYWSAIPWSKRLIEEQKLSKSQSVQKIRSRGAKIAAIKDQPIPALQLTGYDSVII